MVPASASLLRCSSSISCTDCSELSIMVPRNFGAEAPDRLKPHFVHGVAVSSFLVPQFGQNTTVTSRTDPSPVRTCLPKGLPKEPCPCPRSVRAPLGGRRGKRCLARG